MDGDLFVLADKKPRENPIPIKKEKWYQGKPVGSVIVLAVVVLGCMGCDWFALKDPAFMDLKNCSVMPGRLFWFGTDVMGRDIFSGIWYGGRISLFIGFASTVISTGMAVVIGSVSGMAPPWLDEWIMRFAEIFMSVPGLLLIILLQAVLGYTGEVSASQLKSYNAEYCIVGHSERREYQKESNEEISLKINKLFTEGIIPILCVGETKEQRENNQVEAVLKEEILSATKTLSNEEKSKLIIAYEPIWSIGTGIIPTNIEITAVFKYIKEFLPDSKILYGGSANEKNVDILKEVSLIDGYLLGGLSLKPQDLKIFLNKLEN